MDKITETNEITELEMNQMRFLIENNELYVTLLVGIDNGLKTIKEAVFFCDYHAEEYLGKSEVITRMHKIYTAKQKWDKLELGENIPEWLMVERTW